jgi:hypothetical protein
LKDLNIALFSAKGWIFYKHCIFFRFFFQIGNSFLQTNSELDIAVSLQMEVHDVSLLQLRVPSADHSSNGVRPRPEGGQQRGIPVQEAPTSHPHRLVCRNE